jgi:hypothetical protein
MAEMMMCQRCFKMTKTYLLIEVGGEEKNICRACVNRQRQMYRTKLQNDAAKRGSHNNLLGAVLKGQGDE